MYLRTYDLALVVPNCPTSYWRTKARDPKVRVAQRAIQMGRIPSEPIPAKIHRTKLGAICPQPYLGEVTERGCNDTRIL